MQVAHHFDITAPFCFDWVYKTQAVTTKKETLKQINDTFHAYAKNEINTLKSAQPQIPSKEALKLYTQPRGTTT